MLSPIEVQRLASDPAYSVYVSASAGTGKTRILCDRYLRLMLNGTPPENILCVTFTIAAAAEMEERIRTTLSKWKDLSDEDLKKTIMELTGNEHDIAPARNLYDRFLAALSKIKTQNLHSFCMDILQYYVHHEQPNNNKIIDAFMQARFFKEAFTKTINKPENKEHVDILACHYSFERVLELVSTIIKEKTNLCNYAKTYSKESIFNEHNLDGCCREEDLYEAFWTAVPDEVLNLKLPQITEAVERKDFNNYRLVFLTQAGEPRKKVVPKNFIGDTSCIAKETDRILAHHEKLNCLYTAETNYAILTIAYETLKEYELRKSNAGFVDFDDLLLNTICLLQDSALATSVLYSLDYRIDHILVDEAQDLSLKQWQVINLISEEFFAGIGAREIVRTIFIVGDYKQSIYSFQGANPAIFLQMKEFYKQRVSGAGYLWREVELEYSFRTTQPVLSVVDKIFSTSHIPYRDGDGHKERIELVEKDEKKEKSDSWAFPTPEASKKNCRQLLAEKIVALIGDWLKKGRLLAGHKRRIVPSDILILVRKRSEFTRMLSACLTKHHIPYVHQDKIRLSEELIVKDLLALANFILLPVYDFNLACLLKSPLIGCNDDDLFRFAFRRPDTLYDNLSEDIKSKLTYFRDLAQTLSVYEFFSTVLDCDNARLDFVARFGKRANFVIDQFLEAALAFEHNYIPSFATFIEWIENGGADEESPQFSAPNSVRIMTVHSAKGLQAPIVIIADAASSEQTPNEQVFWHNDKFYFSVRKEFDNNIIKQIKKHHKEAQAEESKRLLYVAMTRAEDELYIAGWDNNYKDASWYNLIAKKADNIIHQAEYSMTSELIEDEVAGLPEYLKEKVIAPSNVLKTMTATEKAIVKTPEILRGEIIHDLLHKLPLCHDQRHYFEHIKNRFSHYFAPNELDEMYEKAHIVITKFPEFFAPHALSEVPIAGTNNVNARIDKLLIEPTLVKIVDFKSDKTHDNISHYRSQLNFYKKLIRNIYPDKHIESYILWVEKAEISKMDA